ncbi:MAG: histidine phosphatase family protein [Weeksellaceae bacterium]|nr:histidine phosphatase family protein [Weeksellaceae bacterium]
MRNYISSILVLLCIFCHQNIWAQSANNSKITTFILVRHAEKADHTPNTELSENGKKRAQALARLLSNVKIDAIYTTPLKRTQQTAQMVAEENNLKINSYDVDATFSLLTDHLTNKYKGKTILLVGHSNTLPVNIERLTQHNIEIPETEFDNVYIIQVNGNDHSVNMLQLKYGE